MITSELFRAFVQQAWNGPAASRADMSDIILQQQQQQQQQQRGYSQANGNAVNALMSCATGSGVTAPLYSPLDCPDLLMLYYNASCNALLRYHCDMPILQPRTTYSLPRRVSPASVGHSRGRVVPLPQQQRPPPPSYAHATLDSHRASSSYMHVRHDEASSSPSADATYRPGRYTDMRGPTVMPADRHTRNSLDYTDEHDTYNNEDDYMEAPVAERRPSWSPQQMRYRRTSGSSGSDNVRPRASSGVSFSALNYGGITEGGIILDDDDDEEEVLERRMTIQLDTRHTRPRGERTSTPSRRSSHLMHPRHTHPYADSNTGNSNNHHQQQQHHHHHYHSGPPDVASSWALMHGRGGGDDGDEDEDGATSNRRIGGEWGQRQRQQR